MLAKYSITLTGPMLATFFLKGLLGIGFWVLYKTFNPSQAAAEVASKVPETKMSKMIKYVKTAAMTIVELGAIIAGMQGIQYGAWKLSQHAFDFVAPSLKMQGLVYIGIFLSYFLVERYVFHKKQ